MSARNETPHKIIQSMGKQKCNGSWEEASENLTMDQVKKLAEDQSDRLTGANPVSYTHLTLPTILLV